MMSHDGIPQIFPVKMSIYFRCKNRFVPEHFLDSPKVSSSVDQMGGKGMPEGMRTYSFPDTCFFCKLFYQGENHHPGHFASSAIKK